MSVVALVVALAALLAGAPPAAAQSIGMFRWQCTPYCNVVTLDVTQVGAQYRFEGAGDQCGAATVAPVSGLNVINPNGTLSIGFAISTPAGPVDVNVAFDVGQLGGTWRDGAGNTGALVFRPGPATAGPLRPSPTTPLADGSVTTPKLAAGAVDSSRILDGTITAVDVDAAEVQRLERARLEADRDRQTAAAERDALCQELAALRARLDALTRDR